VPSAPPISQPAVAPRLSIVVLPFANLSNDPEQEYFVDALTEDLTADLSRIEGMFVIAYGTACTFKGKAADAKRIGHELGVRYVLEGSVRKFGPRVRVNAQLIDAETAAHVWAELFDRDADDLFEAQDEIAGRIAVELNLNLLAAEAAKPTKNSTALEYLLQARVTARVMAAMPADAADIERARALAEGALAASPRDPLAHYARAQVLRALGHWQEAASDYEACIAGNRNFATAYAHLAQCRMLSGAIDEAIPLAERAIRLSPRDPNIGDVYIRIGIAHLLQSRHDEAIAWLERARAAAPAGVPPRVWLAAAYGLAGNHDQATSELAQARGLPTGDRYSTLGRLRAAGYHPTAPENWGVPKIRALFEATFFAGLRKAGMTEE